MPQEKLDLFQFAAGGAAKSGTSSAKVVRCQVAHSRLCGEVLNDVPGKLFADPISPRLARTTHTTEQLSRLDSRGFDPRAEFAIHPVWNRNRPDMTAFAAQVYDRPMSLALLEMINGQLGYFVTPLRTRRLLRHIRP